MGESGGACYIPGTAWPYVCQQLSNHYPASSGPIAWASASAWASNAGPNLEQWQYSRRLTTARPWITGLGRALDIGPGAPILGRILLSNRYQISTDRH